MPYWEHQVQSALTGGYLIEAAKKKSIKIGLRKRNYGKRTQIRVIPSDNL
jgi:hypothetical protein